MKTENHCILSKLHSDLIYIDFRMCEHSSLSKFYGDLQQTPSFWHRTARGTTRSARDPSGTTRLRTRPQDDIVLFAGGCAPCTPAFVLLYHNTFSPTNGNNRSLIKKKNIHNPPDLFHICIQLSQQEPFFRYKSEF